jgi:hypothetical protein
MSKDQSWILKIKSFFIWVLPVVNPDVITQPTIEEIFTNIHYYLKFLGSDKDLKKCITRNKVSYVSIR